MILNDWNDGIGLSKITEVLFLLSLVIFEKKIFDWFIQLSEAATGDVTFRQIHRKTLELESHLWAAASELSAIKHNPQHILMYRKE